MMNSMFTLRCGISTRTAKLPLETVCILSITGSRNREFQRFGLQGFGLEGVRKRAPGEGPGGLDAYLAPASFGPAVSRRRIRSLAQVQRRCDPAMCQAGRARPGKAGGHCAYGRSLSRGVGANSLAMPHLSPMYEGRQIGHQATSRLEARAARDLSLMSENPLRFAASAVGANQRAPIDPRRRACLAAPGVIPTSRAYAAGPPNLSITSENE